MTIRKNGRTITTLEQWAEYAGPKRAGQWKDDRSAKEAARCWLAVASPAMPTEIERLLAGHPAFGAIRSWNAEPELRLPFDDFPGEPRNTDLLVHAQDVHGEILLAIEAKADEPFGASVASTVSAARKRRVKNPRSNGIARVETLVKAIVGATDWEDPRVQLIRYQLLTAAAGAVKVAESRHIKRVVLLIQEFKSSLTNDKKHAANMRTLEQFLLALSGGLITSVEVEKLYGPFSFGGSSGSERPALYIGKVIRNLRGESE